MTELIFSAINILTKPPGGCGAACSQQEALSAALGANRIQLLEQLEGQSRLQQVRRLREEVMAEALWLSSGTGDVTWDFVQELLLLLLSLARHLSAEAERFERTQASEAARRPLAEEAPPLSPEVLSVSQQKTLASALQFVVSLGLCPYLAPGVGAPLAQRSAFGAVVQNLCCERAREPRRRLLTTASVLLQFAELPSLATPVSTQHLNHLMAALCQLGYQREAAGAGGTEASLELSAEERRSCREALGRLLGNTYQPAVIQELLLLQNGPQQPSSGGGGAAPAPTPAWLRRLCGQLLSERLMQPGGVHAVVRAVLGQGEEERSGWRRSQAVARVLVTCPRQSASADGYYASVCPQILELLRCRAQLAAPQYQRVAVAAVQLMAQERPRLAQQLLLAPVLAPLQRCLPAAAGASGPAEPAPLRGAFLTAGRGPSRAAGQVELEVEVEVVEEWELSRCVDELYKICVLGAAPPGALLTAVQEVLPVLFALFSFSRQNVCHLRTSCQELLLWLLRHSPPEEALQGLRQLCGPQPPPRQAAPLRFRPGSQGGARLCAAGSGSVPAAAEEDVLRAQPWRLECVTLLLAELKDSDLPGTFFLLLLQELTDWVSCEEGQNQEEELTLGAGVDQPGPRGQPVRRLALLQALAAMVEGLPPAALLRKRTQVVDFLAALFQRACVGLGGASGPGLVSVVDSETLSMGLGLLATLLSEPQLGDEDYLPTLKLLPHLETLSQAHPEALLQELAFGLRAVIATRGACRPEDLARPGRSPPAGARRPPAPVPERQPRALCELLLEAEDPDVPTRAAALRGLSRLLQGGAGEAVRAREVEEILRVLLRSLEHQDSFVYLSAIQGLAVMAERFPERLLHRLLQDFQPSAPLELRLKTGEVLMRASSAMGDLAPHLGRPLLRVFLQGSRDPEPSVRASSLSNLGALCRRLDYSLGPLAQELSSCLTALIKTEKEAEVRRAAVHVISQLLQGLSDRTTQVLGEVLLDLYRALKWALRSDPDPVTVLQAQLALEELDGLVRRAVFPEQKLQKKIVVLP